MTHKMITGIAPYAHVASVKNSIRFYEILGMSCVSVYGPADDPFWAMMEVGGQKLMLARASGPVDHTIQAVLFYTYAPDVKAFRAQLVDAGLPESEGEFAGRGCVLGISHPHHMPAGELRAMDPDGYVVLVGQLGDPT